MTSIGSSHRELALDGLVNARDLGGLRRQDGTLTPRGVFFRSENVDWLTARGWQQLKDSGVRTIVDLRRSDEREHDRRPRPDWVHTVNFDLDGLEHTQFWDRYWDNGLVGTALYYLPHLEQLPQRAGNALRTVLAAGQGGVLFHCMGGRDRTRLLAMLLQVAVDVDTEDIVDDYMETVRRGDLRAASENRNNAEAEIEALCRAHGTTTEGAFRTVLEEVTLDVLLEAAEFTPDERRALRSWRGAIPHS